MKKRTNIKFNQSLSTTCYFNWEQRALMSFPVPVVPTFTKVHDIVFGSLKIKGLELGFWEGHVEIGLNFEQR